MEGGREEAQDKIKKSAESKMARLKRRTRGSIFNSVSDACFVNKPAGGEEEYRVEEEDGLLKGGRKNKRRRWG